MSSSLTLEFTAEPTFVCDCEERMRSACAGEPFYKEHEGNHYCVLHFPGKEKSEDFKRALERKLADKDFNFRGVWFPDELSFSHFSFSGKLDFGGATFNAKVNFNSARFRAEAYFSSATFIASVYFTSAIFNKGADFFSTTFCGEAYFTDVTFRGKANFSAVEYFRPTTFDAKADFVYARFIKGADFSNTTFSAEAYFSFATFGAVADFRAAAHFTSATFSSNAYFNNAGFSAEAYFISAGFSKGAEFISARFGAVAYFDDATFSKKADFSLANFNEKVAFSSATFRDHVTFTGNENGSVFSGTSSLDLQSAVIEKSDHISFHTLALRPHWFVNIDARKFDFTNVDWTWHSTGEEVESLKRKFISSPHRMLAIACRHLAVNAEENHRYEEASKFRYMAMDARRLEKWHGFTIWRLSWWYWLASGYGERTLRAFAVLIGAWLLFALLYTQVGFVRWEPKRSNEKEAMIEQRDEAGEPLKLTRALTYSLGVMTLQKPEPRPATIAAQSFVILETILGPVQAALLALAIRRKFMR
jgi:Pentapeptide repeats (9 copies)